MTDSMRFAMVSPENCPFCQRKADQVEASMRTAGCMSENAIWVAREIARCEGHREA